jgi:hypothetical protein
VPPPIATTRMDVWGVWSAGEGLNRSFTVGFDVETGVIG